MDGEPVNREAGPLLVFDGDCGFCTRSARWIQRRLPDGVGVEPWQALDLDELGLTVADVTGAAWWLSPARPRPARGHEAIGRALAAAGGAWGVAGKLIVRRPGSWLARPVYAVIARNRHRMPGGAPACQTPDDGTGPATSTPASETPVAPASDTPTAPGAVAPAATPGTAAPGAPGAAPPGISPASTVGGGGASLADRR